MGEETTNVETIGRRMRNINRKTDAGETEELKSNLRDKISVLSPGTCILDWADKTRGAACGQMEEGGQWEARPTDSITIREEGRRKRGTRQREGGLRNKSRVLS